MQQSVFLTNRDKQDPATWFDTDLTLVWPCISENYSASLMSALSVARHCGRTWSCFPFVFRWFGTMEGWNQSSRGGTVGLTLWMTSLREHKSWWDWWAFHGTAAVGRTKAACRWAQLFVCLYLGETRVQKLSLQSWTQLWCHHLPQPNTE